MKTWTYKIDHLGEPAAGINAFTDTITISVDSGDPGGELTGEYSFQEHMLSALWDWYYGVKVELVEPK